MYRKLGRGLSMAGRAEPVYIHMSRFASRHACFDEEQSEPVRGHLKNGMNDGQREGLGDRCRWAVDPAERRHDGSMCQPLTFGFGLETPVVHISSQQTAHTYILKDKEAWQWVFWWVFFLPTELCVPQDEEYNNMTGNNNSPVQRVVYLNVPRVQHLSTLGRRKYM